jgi:hypothetical protein
MRRPLLRRLAPAAGLLAALAILPGCQDEKSDAARAAADALGVQDSEAQTEPKDVIVRDTKDVIDPETGEVLSHTVEETPVEVQVKVNKDVRVETGETRTATSRGED